MIPIVVTWTQYTATVNGQVLKLVPCENCQTEYVYVLEREAKGYGNTVYLLSVDGDKANAAETADLALRDYLANDYDPVPCPVCGHYQRSMFPKLMETRSPWALVGTLAVLGGGGLTAVSAAYWTVEYLQQRSDHALGRMAVTWSILAVIGLIGAGLSAVQRTRARRFDPNATEDQESRIAKGRNRAVTRAEFEAKQRQRST